MEVRALRLLLSIEEVLILTSYVLGFNKEARHWITFKIMYS